MISKTIHIKNERNVNKIIKHWELCQIKDNNDALEVNVGDIIEHEEMYVRITYCGNARPNSHRAWCGRVYNAKSRWGLKDDTVIAWGPMGVANSFYDYENGNFLDFCLGKESYLWLGY